MPTNAMYLIRCPDCRRVMEIEADQAAGREATMCPNPYCYFWDTRNWPDAAPTADVVDELTRFALGPASYRKAPTMNPGPFPVAGLEQ